MGVSSGESATIATIGVGAMVSDPEGLTPPYELHLGDSLAWLGSRAANSIHAIVTDPPYGLKEYSEVEKGKLRGGRGGVWRIPPTLDGCRRSPLPRFTVLDQDDHAALDA